MSPWLKKMLDGVGTRSAQVGAPRPVGWTLLLACLAGVLVIRLQLLFFTQFPINDGGFFYLFVEAVAGVFPALPPTVDYNNFKIPFAYPPLSFWLAAAVVQWGAQPLDILHNAPILMNMAYVVLFALLLLRTGHSLLFTAAAVLVFGTTLRSYEWLVMGGGLSRGMGSLFLLATLLLLMKGPADPARWTIRSLVGAGVCVGATMLSHLEWGMLAAASAIVCLAVARPGLPAFLRASFIVGVTALAVVVPWFLWVYSIHGLAPFEAAAKTGSWRASVVTEAAQHLVRTSTYLLPFVLLGAVTVAKTRDVFWVIFVAVALLLTPRSGATPMVLALGVLAASGFFSLVVMFRSHEAAWARSALVGLVVVAVVLAGMRAIAAMNRPELFADLPLEQRRAMEWVARHHPGARFAVLREAPWYYDGAAEWFPVLARASNVTTIQGREWLPDDNFRRASVAVDKQNASTSCPLILQNIGAFGTVDFIWTEGIDLPARAQMLNGTGKRKTLRDRMTSMPRGLTATRTPYRGSRPGALYGEGTLAGCFDAAGYQEVYSNARVRIFRSRNERPMADVRPRDAGAIRRGEVRSLTP